MSKDPIQPRSEDAAAAPVSGELLPVPAEPRARPIERMEPVPVPAPVVAATGGLVAGFATLVLVRLLRGGRRSRGIRLGRGRRGLEVSGSRSFLVDVHMLKR